MMLCSVSSFVVGSLAPGIFPVLLPKSEADYLLFYNRAIHLCSLFSPPPFPSFFPFFSSPDCAIILLYNSRPFDKVPPLQRREVSTWPLMFRLVPFLQSFEPGPFNSLLPEGIVFSPGPFFSTSSPSSHAPPERHQSGVTPR